MTDPTYHLYTGKIVKILSCSNCNANCKHCYISFNGNFSAQQLTEVVNNLIERHEVRINGTEPLLHKEYLEALKKTRQQLILTNGLVFRNNYEYISELLNYNINTIGISYHFDIHDSISPVNREYLDVLFQEIIKRGLEVQIMTTITSQNYQNILKYCEYCYNHNIRKIRFTNFINQGNATKLDENLILDDKERQTFFQTIDEARNIYPKNILEIQRCGSFGKNESSDKTFKCDAGINSVVMTPDLKVYPCLFFAKPGNEIGYYQDGQIYISNNYENDETQCKALLKLNRKR